MAINDSWCSPRISSIKDDSERSYEFILKNCSLDEKLIILKYLNLPITEEDLLRQKKENLWKELVSAFKKYSTFLQEYAEDSSVLTSPSEHSVWVENTDKTIPFKTIEYISKDTFEIGLSEDEKAFTLKERKAENSESKTRKHYL